jgi:hypothetical protein
MDRIGDSAFSGCTNLREVVFPQSVGETGKYLFFNCDGLADQNGFAVVNGVLYTYCGNAEVIRVPDTVHTIGDRAFESKVVEMTCMGELRQVRRVQRIVLPQSVKRIGERTFDGFAAEDIVAFGIPIRDFPSPELKKLALIGYAMEYQAFQTFPEIVRQNNAYIGTYQKRYLPFVFETDFAECIRILAETGKIDPKEFDEVYLAPAQAAGAVQCTAALIAWRSKLAN